MLAHIWGPKLGCGALRPSQTVSGCGWVLLPEGTERDRVAGCGPPCCITWGLEGQRAPPDALMPLDPRNGPWGREGWEA